MSAHQGWQGAQVFPAVMTVSLQLTRQLCPKLFMGTKAPAITMRSCLLLLNGFLLCRPEQRVGVQHKLGFLDLKIPGYKLQLALRQTVHLSAHTCLLASHSMRRPQHCMHMQIETIDAVYLSIKHSLGPTSSHGCFNALSASCYTTPRRCHDHGSVFFFADLADADTVRSLRH